MTTEIPLYYCQVCQETFANVEEAVSYFKNQNKNIQVVPGDCMVTMDFQLNRVRIWQEISNEHAIRNITYG